MTEDPVLTTDRVRFLVKRAQEFAESSIERRREIILASGPVAIFVAWMAHGSMARVRCLKAGKDFSILEAEATLRYTNCEHCKAPHVVINREEAELCGMEVSR
jgi:hypothetical protein